MLIKPRKSLAIGLPYKCGCKTKEAVAKQIYFSLPEEPEKNTKKLLKAVSEGTFGEEWKQLLLDHPEGSVDCSYDLYICEKCGNWENEERMDFYLPCGEPKYKAVNPYSKDAGYSLYRKYDHVCGKCGSMMHCHHLIDYAEVQPDQPANMATKMNKRKIYDLHLSCKKCKKEIVLLNTEMGIGNYSAYSPAETEPV